MMHRSYFRLCILLIFAVSVPLAAQEYRGRVQGTVTDPGGGAVPGATVTLTNNQTSVAATRSTNDQGQYLFDLVQPGQYTETVEMKGFSKVIHFGILVQERSNVTVDSQMTVGSVATTITIEANAQDIDFNSATVQTTLNSEQVVDLPNYNRNPFLLSQVNPAVVDTRLDYPHPYDTWGSNAISIGGAPPFSNDLLINGTPITLGLKTSYVPNNDAVQELTVQQNAVDAEFGHGTGGIVSVALKSGTNDFHGMAFWRGHYPWLNAAQDRTAPGGPAYSLERENYMGGTFGNPILRDKLFNFASFEYQRREDPSVTEMTLPTDLERTGNFSQSLNNNGTLRTIYNPMTTQTDAQGNVTRQPFPSNIIPSSDIDPVAAKMLTQLWEPNNPGVGPYHMNNYYLDSPQLTLYKNFMDRVDYKATDKLQISGFTGYYSAPAGIPTGLPNSPLFVGEGWVTKGKNDSIDFTYAKSSKTVIDIEGEYHELTDSSSIASSGSTSTSWAQYYPNDPWYTPLTIPGIGLSPFGPGININSAGGGLSFGTPRGTWYANPYGFSIRGKVSHQFNSHFVKYGADYRYEYARSSTDWNSGFGFFGNSTAATYINPNLNASGDAFASFLTGALGDPADYNATWSPTSLMAQNIVYTPVSQTYSLFINDDWKVTRNLTVTLGLRYEYEYPWTDPENRLSKGPDFSAPLPALAANPPQMPAEISQYTSLLPQWTGAWEFASGSSRGGWNPQSNVFLPRVGAAYRLNDKTAISGAWARWAQPWIQQGYGVVGSFLDYVYPGYTATQQPAPMLLGVPQVSLSNPFPATSPLTVAPGQSLGVYSQVGNSGIDVAYQDRKRALTDRFNVMIQRQLPFKILLKATYSFSYSHDLGYNWYPNMLDPRLNYTNYNPNAPELGAITVANPFYLYGTPQTFPGALRYQPQVSLESLMVPYPQYGSITEEQRPGLASRYQELNFTFNRQFQNGLTFMFAYDYNNEVDTQFFNDVATYLQQKTWIPSNNPRHRLSGTFVWDTPVGRNRAYLSDIPRYADALIGGWNVSGIVTWHSGDYLNFGYGNFNVPGMQYNPNCDVHASAPGYWFNTGCFQPLPAYTENVTPWNFPGLTGPQFFNVDATLFKEFALTERFKAKLHLSAFNALNRLNLGDPDLNVFDSTFGKAIYQLANVSGRRLELGLQVSF
jgi:hypothetical protein